MLLRRVFHFCEEVLWTHIAKLQEKRFFFAEREECSHMQSGVSDCCRGRDKSLLISSSITIIKR